MKGASEMRLRKRDHLDDPSRLEILNQGIAAAEIAREALEYTLEAQRILKRDLNQEEKNTDDE